jgi:mono/diheme cytochrome c family protein
MRIEAIEPQQTTSDLVVKQAAGVIKSRHLAAGGRSPGELLHEKCLACHGSNQAEIKGGLDLQTLASTLNDGDSGKPRLVAAKPDGSPLYLAVTRKHDDSSPMPPKEADKLDPEQIAWVRDWITGRAPWLDVTRCADSSGFANDYERGNACRYRDDDNKLTFYHAGRFSQLSQFGGTVIKELIG